MRIHTTRRKLGGLFGMFALLNAVSAEVPDDGHFAITSIDRAPGSGDITLSWTSNPGESYSIETSPTMLPGTWEVLSAAPIPAAETGPETTALAEAAPSRLASYYRVRCLPLFMEMVTVGDPGNGADPSNSPDVPGIGAVGYEFRIGRYEVTNTQYAEFLNSVAVVDLNGLYNAKMASDVVGGITRSGASGSYTYTVKAHMGDKPVNYVSWYDALRFCNWLHNGRPTGSQDGTTTERGAYSLTGVTSVAVGTDPVHGANGRNAGAMYHLPSENEFYKAAYYQPAGEGGDADDYWLYPTRSNNEPTVATADEAGNVNNATDNIANYLRGADWNDQDGNVTTVGSGGAGSASFYGAFDMGGNLREWVEQDIFGFRGQRGGSWGGNSNNLTSSNRDVGLPTLRLNFVGFRVAGP